MELLEDYLRSGESRNYLRHQERAMRTLINERPDFVPMAALVHAVYRDHEDGGPLCAHDLVSRAINLLRARLKPGWKILYRGGFGYRLCHVSELERYTQLTALLYNQRKRANRLKLEVRALREENERLRKARIH